MLSALLLVAIVACPAKTGPVLHESEALESKLTKVITSYSLSEKGFPRALVKAAQDFEIPLGLEWRRAPGGPKEVRLAWRSATVRQIIESIVKSRPGYSLEPKDGIVHVFYVGAIMDKRNPLNIMVHNFQVQDEYVSSVTQRLHSVATGTVFPTPTPVPGKVHSEFRHVVVSAGDHKSTFEVRNGTVRDILDKMAIATDAKVWVTTFDESLGLTPTGFRRTISLWNTYPIPDQYQPGWDLVFVWGPQVYPPADEDVPRN